MNQPLHVPEKTVYLIFNQKKTFRKIMIDKKSELIFIKQAYVRLRPA